MFDHRRPKKSIWPPRGDGRQPAGRALFRPVAEIATVLLFVLGAANTPAVETLSASPIAWDAGRGPTRAPAAPVFSKIAVERRIASRSDDAEERVVEGSVDVKNASLQLAVDGSRQQIVGLRWARAPIPGGATVSAAYVQFTARATQGGATRLSIAGLAADDAATFTASSRNVSSRPRTTASVVWAPNAWSSGQAGAEQRTPDLSAVIQEIVNRPGWASGNALAVTITGTGTRTAYSYDGSASSAPLLHIEYQGDGIGPTARLTTTQAATPPLTASASGSASTPGDSPIASYRFDFGDGSAPVTTTAPVATAQHTYAAAGAYTVTLVATDTGGRLSAPATSSVAINPAEIIAVYVGYYDSHHTAYPRPRPSPWHGSPGVQFVGTPDSTFGGWDSSGIRIDNLSSGSITVEVTVDMGSSHFGLWGAQTVAARGTIIFAQTGYENFDGSDTNPAGCFGCNPTDCLTKVMPTIPVVHVTIGATTTHYYDTKQISNTHGVDMAGCPYTGTRNDESQVWTRIYTQAPAAMMTRDGGARTEFDRTPVRSRGLWLAPVSPNPAAIELVIRYEVPDRQNVSIGIYDVSGRWVKTHVEGELDAGEYLSHISLAGIPAGMYYCRFQAGDRVLHQRFVHVQ